MDLDTVLLDGSEENGFELNPQFQELYEQNPILMHEITLEQAQVVVRVAAMGILSRLEPVVVRSIFNSIDNQIINLDQQNINYGFSQYYQAVMVKVVDLINGSTNRQR